jgi:hypothetical protein
MDSLRSDPKLRARECQTAIGGGKGVPVELIVSLSTPGTVAGLARIVNLWLHRDRRRSLKVSVQTAADEKVVSVAGDEISVEALTAALNAALKLGQEPADASRVALEPGDPTP